MSSRSSLECSSPFACLVVPMGEIISVSVYSNALDLFFFKTQHTMEETESKINVVRYCDHDISVERGNIMTAGHDLPSAV